MTTKLGIPEHELFRPIGSGAYGKVWLARNALGTLRAVKIVRRAQHASVTSFEREFKGLQQFEPVSRAHEGLVDILTLGLLPEDAGFYYVMELADDSHAERGVWTAEATRTRAVTPFSQRRGEGRDGGQATLHSYAPRTLRAELKARGALSADEVIVLGLKLAAALAHLHAHGLVHRDVKPSNILFIGGEPKLADAGLVALVEEARSLVGTAGYIAPEGPGTPRADLYALGKVLYEAAFGKDRQEFPQLPADIAARPEHHQLLELNEIIAKACAPDPSRRYPNATSLGNDLALLQRGQSVKRQNLWRARRKLVNQLAVGGAIAALLVGGTWALINSVGPYPPPQSKSIVVVPFDNKSPDKADEHLGSTTADEKSIVVVPFDNESPDKADEHLGSTTADEISSALAKIPGLVVLGRDSGIALKQAKDLRTAAAPLKLLAVLNGTLRKSGNQLHLTAQLIRPGDGALLWSQVYGGTFSEIFGMQTDIAENVATSLNVALTETTRTRLAVKETKNFEAYQFYLEGCNFLNNALPLKAIGSLRKAIASDTTFAPAYAALAEALTETTREAINPGVETFPEAQGSATKAIELDPSLAEAHAALARIKCHAQYDWEGAGREFQLALRRNTNNVTVHQQYSKYLDILGRFDEAIAHARFAQELDPLSLRAGIGLGWNLFDARRYDEALKEFTGILDELDGNSPEAFDGVGWSYWAKGQTNEALEAWGKAVAPEVNAELMRAYHERGIEGYWQKHLEQAKKGVEPTNKSPYWIACDYAVLGNTNAAIKWLNQAYEERAYYLPYLAVEYRLYGLHSDPRFQALLRKMGLTPPVWKQ